MKIDPSNVTVRCLRLEPGSDPTEYEIVFNVMDEDGYTVRLVGAFFTATELFERVKDKLKGRQWTPPERVI